MQNRELAGYLFGIVSAFTLALIGTGILQGGRYLVAAILAFALGLLLKWPFEPIVWPAFTPIEGQGRRYYRDYREIKIVSKRAVGKVLVVGDRPISGSECIYELPTGEPGKASWLWKERVSDNRVEFRIHVAKDDPIPAGTTLTIRIDGGETGREVRFLSVQPISWLSWFKRQVVPPPQKSSE